MRRISSAEPPLGLFIALAVSAIAQSVEPRVSAAEDRSRQIHGSWRCETTPQFEIWISAALKADKLGETCETLLAQLRKIWHPKQEQWPVKCVVVVHGSLPAYQRAIGSDRDRSVGMATYTLKKGQIQSRRIDLRADADDWVIDALPHEMTHLVLAEANGARPLPRWLDEGLAVLAETPAKQARRQVELDRAVASRNVIPTVELLTLAHQPSAGKRDVFYSQSAHLAAFLVRRESPEAALEFARQSHQHGPDAALRTVYRLAGLGELDRLWKADLLTRRATVQSLSELAKDR